MADIKTFISPTQGVNYQGLSNSPDKVFDVNGLDTVVVVYKIDAVTNTLAASQAISTGLKICYGGKIILPDGTGDASATYLVKPGTGGDVIVTNLNGLAVGSVFILVAYGSQA